MPNNYRVRRIFIVWPWPSLCSPMLPDTDVRCPRVGSSLTERQKFSWKLIPSSCRVSFYELRSLFSKKEPLRINCDGIEKGISARGRKRGRKKHDDIWELFSTQKHEVESLWSRRDARTSLWTSAKRVICFMGVPTRRGVVNRAKTRCQYSAWTAWISSIDCLTLTDTNLCPSDIRATFETNLLVCTGLSFVVFGFVMEIKDLDLISSKIWYRKWNVR